MTVSDRKMAETIHSRLGPDTPLALGARGIASVRTLTPREVEGLSVFSKAAVEDLRMGEHTRVLRHEGGFSIYQRTTFEHYERAWEAYKRGDVDLALQLIEKDLILNPDHAQGLSLIGRLYEERKEERRAAEAYQQLIAFHPQTAVGYRLLGRLYEVEQKWPQAIENYEESLRWDDGQHDILNNLALLYANRLRKPEEGLELIRKALSKKPDAAEYLDTLAVIQQKLGRTRDVSQTRERIARLQKGPGASPPGKPAPEERKAAPAPDDEGGRKARAPSPESPWPSPPADGAPVNADSALAPWPPPPDVSRDLLPPPPRVTDLKPGSALPRETAGQDGRVVVKKAEEAEIIQPALRSNGSLQVMPPSLSPIAWSSSLVSERHNGMMSAGKESGGNGAAGREAKAAPPALRIKILDGTGDIRNAQRLRNMVEARGYRVDRTDVSEKGIWKRTVLFYKRGVDKQAEDLAANLPERPQMRPLTWKSAFDVILVVGREGPPP